MKKIKVIAAIIQNEKKEILICQRAKESDLGGFWEFAGGKLEVGETEEACVIRECMEELNLTIDVNGVFDKMSYCYPDKEIAFTFFRASIVDGILEKRVHQCVCWVKRENLKCFTFCPADVSIVEKLEKTVW